MHTSDTRGLRFLYTDDVGWDAAHALTARPRCSHVSLAQSSAAPPGGSSKPQRAIVRVVVSRDGV